jgi:serine/threonine protein kinase
MNHPNIVNLIKVVDDEANNKCYLILEYVNGGELFDYIITYGRISEKDARRFMRQVGLILLHCELTPRLFLRWNIATRC